MNSLFGEMALLSPEGRANATVSVPAMGFCDAFVLVRERFRELTSIYPSFRRRIERIHASRERENRVLVGTAPADGALAEVEAPAESLSMLNFDRAGDEQPVPNGPVASPLPLPAADCPPSGALPSRAGSPQSEQGPTTRSSPVDGAQRSNYRPKIVPPEARAGAGNAKADDVPPVNIGGSASFPVSEGFFTDMSRRIVGDLQDRLAGTPTAVAPRANGGEKDDDALNA